MAASIAEYLGPELNEEFVKATKPRGAYVAFIEPNDSTRFTETTQVIALPADKKGRVVVVVQTSNSAVEFSFKMNQEAENERMHLMTFIEIAKPNWLERSLILIAQIVFSIAFLY